MITVGMNYRVLPGKEQTFESACRNVIKAMAGVPGHGRSFLYRDVDDASSYLIISEWSERGAFDGFVRSEAFAKVTSWGKEQILADRPRHTVYESPS